MKKAWYIKDNADEIARERYGSTYTGGLVYNAGEPVEFTGVSNEGVAGQVVVRVKSRKTGATHSRHLDPDMLELREVKLTLTARELLEQLANSPDNDPVIVNTLRGALITQHAARSILEATEG